MEAIEQNCLVRVVAKTMMLYLVLYMMAITELGWQQKVYHL